MNLESDRPGPNESGPPESGPQKSGPATSGPGELAAVTDGVTTSGSGQSNRVQRLVGVYDADSSHWAELVYLVTSRLGGRHCSLCDITHATVREKKDWRAFRSDLSVPFATFHRDDQPDTVRDAAADVTPVVVAETEDRAVVLLGPDEIDRCSGSIEDFALALDDALQANGLGPARAPTGMEDVSC